VLEDQQRSRVAVRAPHQREHVGRPGAEVRHDPEVERLRGSERTRAITREPDDVRRAGDVGVELAVGHEAAARPGHVTERDVDHVAGAPRPGAVLLERAERPVAVVEHHADAARPDEGDGDVLPVHSVEVAERDGVRRRRHRDVDPTEPDVGVGHGDSDQ
jgi:hypothetical protein